jgi:N,N'-diacetylchitobiose transport system permease protein
MSVRTVVRPTGSRTPGRRWAASILTILLVFALAPVYWMVSSAFKSNAELGSLTPTLFPQHPTLEQFRAVLADGSLLRSLLFSGLVALLTTAAVVVLAAGAAYAVTHWTFPGSRHFLVGVLFTQLLPQSAVLIPVYLLWSALGLIGTGAGLGLVYVSLYLPVAVWMLTGFFRSIPIDLTEAGRIDGASSLRILLSIILPIAKPALAATAIYTALACWSEFLLALVLLTGDSTTVTVWLAGLIGQHGTDLGQLMAASTIVTIPPVIAFLALQRFFVAGLTMGSVKG